MSSIQRYRSYLCYVRHPTASKLLLLLTLLLGVWGAFSLRVTLLPKFTVPVINVSVSWPGASATDVEARLLRPMEMLLGQLRQLDSMRALAKPGSATISLRFNLSRDLNSAYNEVRQLLAAMRSLPQNARTPQVRVADFVDPVTSVLVIGKKDGEELRGFAYTAAQQLQDLGAAKVDIFGLQDSQVRINLRTESMLRYQLSLPWLVDRIKQNNAEFFAGEFGRADKSVMLRTPALADSMYALGQLPLINQQQSPVLTLGMLADIVHAPVESSPFFEQKSAPVVKLTVYRPEQGDSVQIAQQVKAWLRDSQLKLRDSISLQPFQETWTFVYNRLQLLLRNAFSGLFLIGLILTVAIGWRLASWVVLGIPIAILLTLLVLYAFDRSLNVMSAFAFILALGIIVDDSIVVAEQTATWLASGLTPDKAATRAVLQMFRPVMSSSLTTVAAMLPLFFVRGVWADFLLDIPLVIVAVILASLLECFLILPAHLASVAKTVQPQWQQRLFAATGAWVDRYFSPLLSWCVYHPGWILSALLALIMATLALLHSSQVMFVFYPRTDGEEMIANVTFVPSTSLQQRKAIMQKLEQSLWEVNAKFQQDGAPVLQNVLVQYNAHVMYRSQDRLRAIYPQRYAAVLIELVDRDQRVLDNDAIIRAWKPLWPQDNAIAKIEVQSAQGGPVVDDFAVRLRGQSLSRLKAASMELQQRLEGYNGVYNIGDDLPYGQERILYELMPGAMQMGLSKADLGLQLQALLQGRSVGYWYAPNREIDVRVGLDPAQGDRLSTLESLPVQLPNKQLLPLSSLATFKRVAGFDLIAHANGLPALRVQASIDPVVVNRSGLLSQLWQHDLPDIARKYGLQYSKTGSAMRQQSTLTDMGVGAIVGAVLIYLILVAMFGSFLLPWAIIVVVPLGLIGAIWGHWLMGMPLSLFSLFGFFTLAGIVINDAIILLVRFQELLPKLPFEQALMDACRQRIRAVLLTSVTTIGGLVPILIDQSATARYFHTTVVTIIFGLAFSTGLILLVVPVLLRLLYRGYAVWQQCYQRLSFYSVNDGPVR